MLMLQTTENVQTEYNNASTLSKNKTKTTKLFDEIQEYRGLPQAFIGSVL